MNPRSESNASNSGSEPTVMLTASDLQRLAEKVYRLMIADLRLERARGVRAPQRKER